MNDKRVNSIRYFFFLKIDISVLINDEKDFYLLLIF